MTSEQLKLIESKLKMTGNVISKLNNNVIVSYKKNVTENLYSDLKIFSITDQEVKGNQTYTDIFLENLKFGYRIAVEFNGSATEFAYIDSFGNIYKQDKGTVGFKETEECIVVHDSKFVYYFNKINKQKKKFGHNLDNLAGDIRIYGKAMFIGSTFFSLTNGMYIAFNSLSFNTEYIECEFVNVKERIELMKDGKVYARREIRNHKDYCGAARISDIIMDKKAGRLFNVEECNLGGNGRLYGYMSDILTRKEVEFSYQKNMRAVLWLIEQYRN